MADHWRAFNVLPVSWATNRRGTTLPARNLGSPALRERRQVRPLRLR